MLVIILEDNFACKNCMDFSRSLQQRKKENWHQSSTKRVKRMFNILHLWSDFLSSFLRYFPIFLCNLQGSKMKKKLIFYLAKHYFGCDRRVGGRRLFTNDFTLTLWKFLMTPWVTFKVLTLLQKQLSCLEDTKLF